MTAQDKILHVANKLGLTSLKDMQASTGAVYDRDTDLSGQIFSNATRHQNPSVTNINDNQFEVNEALLIESIGFTTGGGNQNFQRAYGSSAVLVFSVVIGNKTVIKDTPIFGSGSPYTFSNVGTVTGFSGGVDTQVYLPRHQVFMEGAGILIPPQVQYYVEYRIFDVVTGLPIAVIEGETIGCYLFGTKVLLNFNTSI
jgi:hypothetical protein